MPVRPSGRSGSAARGPGNRKDQFRQMQRTDWIGFPPPGRHAGLGERGTPRKASSSSAHCAAHGRGNSATACSSGACSRGAGAGRGASIGPWMQQHEAGVRGRSGLLAGDSGGTGSEQHEAGSSARRAPALGACGQAPVPHAPPHRAGIIPGARRATVRMKTRRAFMRNPCAAGRRVGPAAGERPSTQAYSPARGGQCGAAGAARTTRPIRARGPAPSPATSAAAPGSGCPRPPPGSWSSPSAATAAGWSS